MTDITLRSTKGSPLTEIEMDANFSGLTENKAERYIGAVNPTVNNDSTDTAILGVTFKEGDTWVNTATGKIFKCFDSSVGVADWKDITDAVNQLLSSITGTDHSVQDMQNYGHSAGVVYAAVGIDNVLVGGTGHTVNLEPFSYYLRTSATESSELIYGEYPGVTGLSCPTVDTLYYIILSYNAGTPQVTAELTDISTGGDSILLGTAYNDGSVNMHEVMCYPDRFNDHALLMSRATWETLGLRRALGDIISNPSSRHIALSSGVWWAKYTEFTTNAYDSSVTPFVEYYKAAGVWASQTANLINNTQYNNGTDLVNLNVNRYGVRWVYRGVSDSDVRVVIDSTNAVQLADAELASVPTDIPGILSGTRQYALVGKIIVQQSNASLIEINSAFTSTLTQTQITDHENLTNLLGGAVGDHYHLTATQHAIAIQEAGSAQAGYVGTGAQNFSGKKTFDAGLDAGSNQVTNVATPLTPNAAANKEYVDGAINGLDWQESVQAEVDFTVSEPGTPATGDRYINTSTGNSSSTIQAVTALYVYEWNGSSWTEIIPNDGFTVWNEGLDKQRRYSDAAGPAWIDLGATVTHNNLAGLQGGATGEKYHLTAAQHSAEGAEPTLDTQFTSKAYVDDTSFLWGLILGD